MIPILLFFGLCFFGFGDCEPDTYLEDRLKALEELSDKLERQNALIFGFTDEHRISKTCWNKYESGDWGFKDLYYGNCGDAINNITLYFTIDTVTITNSTTISDEQMNEWGLQNIGNGGKK